MGSVSNAAVTEYVGECEEILRRVSSMLAALEKGEAIETHIDALYRDIHTLKGSSQLFGYTEIGRLGHGIEASLGPIRKYKTAMSAPLIESIYRCLDLIELMVKAISAGSTSGFSQFETDYNTTYSNLIVSASRQFSGEFFALNETLVSPDQKPESRLSKTIQHANPPTAKVSVEIEKTKTEVRATPISEATPQVKPPAKIEAPIPIVSQIKPEIKPEVKPEIRVELKPDAKPEIKQEAKSEVKHEVKKDAPIVGTPADTTIRVHVDLLDRLMNLTGELVLVRNQVLQHANKSENLEFINLSQSLNLVTSELQGEVMKTRMQPIGNVVSKFQRVVRDLAKDLGKQIDLTLQGSETELDKTLLEAIKDPLTHLVRNSCDHGIETTAERRAAGKPETGHVMIRSFHEGGQVVIEISDDGKGLDKERILAKAVEKGLLSPEKSQKLPERDIFNLIFLPGFSTASQVSAVSGRGVGMDVVKTNIEKIGGTVDLVSQLKKGTTIKLKIPLTLAIIPALIVRHGSERFAIPQVKLVELVRVDGKNNSGKIEYLQKKPMYRLRGSLLPLVKLDDVFDRESAKSQNEGTSNIVVLDVEGERFGLIVDEILDTTDIVVKPLSQILKFLSIFSGATIMGDGTVSLILDVAGVALKAHVASGNQRGDDGFSDIVSSKKKVNPDAQEFLLFRLRNRSLHAVPLCLVHRLEEFQTANIEHSGSQQVIQYRNTILPLISLNAILKYEKLETPQERTAESVIVIQKSDRLFGVIVDEILDVVMMDTVIDDTIRDREGVLGNLLHEKEVIVVVDALGIIEMEMIRLGKKPRPNEYAGTSTSISTSNSTNSVPDSLLEIEKIKREQNKKTKILFAEDVAFFRRQVSKVLLQAGYEVLTADNGAKAFQMLESSAEGDITLVLSDIEMPEMNGLELARAIRKVSRFEKLPLVAITTRFRDSDIREGKQAGFDMYLEKLNEEVLLKSVETILQQKSGGHS